MIIILLEDQNPDCYSCTQTNIMAHNIGGRGVLTKYTLVFTAGIVTILGYAVVKFLLTLLASLQLCSLIISSYMSPTPYAALCAEVW